MPLEVWFLPSLLRECKEFRENIVLTWSVRLEERDGEASQASRWPLTAGQTPGLQASVPVAFWLLWEGCWGAPEGWPETRTGTVVYPRVSRQDNARLFCLLFS